MTATTTEKKPARALPILGGILPIMGSQVPAEIFAGITLAALAIPEVMGYAKAGVLGTAQRNVSAAIVVTAQNFSSGNTLAFVLVAAIVLLLILLPTAKRLGTRMRAQARS